MRATLEAAHSVIYHFHGLPSCRFLLGLTVIHFAGRGQGHETLHGAYGVRRA